MNKVIAREAAYKLIFAKTGKEKNLRTHARNVLKKFDRGVPIPEVMVKISSFSKSVKSLTSHMDYVSRNGEVDVYNSMDNKIGSEDESPKKALHRISNEVGELDKKQVKNKRLACNLILSMPPNTPKKEFRESVREFLSDMFSNHDYTYAFHDDTDCYHSHICIPMLGLDGKRLNPRRDDLSQWRENFAGSLERNGILANSMTAPSHNRTTLQRESFKYPDTTLFEHGSAPYEFVDNNTESYYVKLQQENGELKTLWGKDLERVINEKEIDNGDRAYFSYKGSEEVDIIVNKKDKAGNVLGKKTITVERHTWDGDKLPEKETANIVRPLSSKNKDTILAAWATIKTDFEQVKDHKTAAIISQFCQTRFGKYLPIARYNQKLDEITR